MNRSGGSIGQKPALSNLQLRIVSGIVLAAVAVAETWAGGGWFRLFCVGIGTAIFVEWALMTRGRSDARHQLLSAALLAMVFIVSLGGWAAPLLALAVGAGLCLAAGLATGRWFSTLSGFVYAGASALALAAIRGDDGRGLAVLVMLFAVVWATDIMAYFVGRAVGGPKLAPAISPGKTWSGAVGGAVFGVAAGLAAAAFAGIGASFGLGLLCLFLSAVSQAGDLFESWIKRRCGVKDSSRLIPGHGGVMDRVDGLVAAAVALYLIGVAVGGRGDVVGWLFAPQAGAL